MLRHTQEEEWCDHPRVREPCVHAHRRMHLCRVSSVSGPVYAMVFFFSSGTLIAVLLLHQDENSACV